MTPDPTIVEYLLARAPSLLPEAVDLAFWRATIYNPNSIRAEVRDLVRAQEESSEEWSRKQQQRLARTRRRAEDYRRLATDRDPTAVKVLREHVYPHIVPDGDPDFDTWLAQRYPPPGAPRALVTQWLKQEADKRYEFVMGRLVKQLPDPLPATFDPEPYLEALWRVSYSHRRSAFLYLQEFLYWAQRAGHTPLAPLPIENPYGRDTDPRWLWDLDEWQRSAEGRPAIQFDYYALRTDMAAALTRAGGYEDPKVLMKATMTLPGADGRKMLPKNHCAKVAGALQRFVTWHAKLDEPYGLDTDTKKDAPHPCLVNELVTVELTLAELADFHDRLMAALKELAEGQGGVLELYSATEAQRPTAAFLALCSTWWGHKLSPLVPQSAIPRPKQRGLQTATSE